MNKLSSTCLLLVLGACGAGGARPVGSDIQSQEDVRPGASTWLPLVPGTAWIYAGENEGRRLDEVVTVHTPEDLPGIGPCTPVWQTRYEAGALVEQTVEWFLVDHSATVWRAGEASWEFVDGRLQLTPDSWRAGEAGMGLVLHLPADARRGDRFAIELPAGRETFEIVDDGARTSVPAGAFEGCLEVHENAGTEDQDIILYGAGVGIVEERWAGGIKVLVEHRRPGG